MSGSKRRLTRREFVKSGVGAGLALAAGRPARIFSIGKAAAEGRGRVIVLGFDGVEPSIVREMIAQGQLPNLAKIQAAGAFTDLKTTVPPQSPVAWSSFMTSKNPGGHNIYDFIRRDPRGRYGPTPYVGTGKMDSPELAPDGAMIKPAEALTYRKGKTFWSVADEQGQRCKILNVPFAFPADTMANGIQLCGLGVPDLRGTTSTFVSLSDGFTQAEVKERLSGGMRMALAFDSKDVAQIDVPGPRDQRYGFTDPKGFTRARAAITISRAAGKGTAEVGGKKVELVQGQWSEWLEFPFAMSPTVTVYGITRFFPFEIGAQVRIYMACQQFHPTHPYVPFTSPNDYAEQLRERFGLFKTVGWAYDTHALRQDAMDEDVFMQDVRRTMAWREKLTLDEIDRGEFNMLVSAWTATDRVGHMFWRFRDEKHPLYDPEQAKKYGKTLEESYQIMDGIVGRVMAELREEDLFMVMSDHGFGSWRTGFNVNTWLKEQGYLSVSDPQRAQVGFLQGINWAQTKAYAIGLSSLYLNLRGRETKGTVSPDEADNVIAEIRDKLLDVVEPHSGDPVFREVYTRHTYKGEALDEAPDFSLGYQRYYQNDKTAAKGGVAETLFEPNDSKWSGEHAASDAAWKSGMLFSNRGIEKEKPDIRDISVTTLKFLGADVPGDYEGESLV